MCAYNKMWSLSYKISNGVNNTSISFLFGEISRGTKKFIYFETGFTYNKSNRTDDGNNYLLGFTMIYWDRN